MKVEDLKAEWEFAERNAKTLSFSYKYMNKLLAVAEAAEFVIESEAKPHNKYTWKDGAEAPLRFPLNPPMNHLSLMVYGLLDGSSPKGEAAYE